MIEAWPNVLEGLKAPLRAAMQHAQPIGVEQGIVVFGVPAPRFDAINGRFRNEADDDQGSVRRRSSASHPRFMLPAARLRRARRAAAGRRRGRRRRRSRTAAVVDVTEEEPEIDLNELVDAPDVRRRPIPSPGSSATSVRKSSKNVRAT